MLISDIAKFDDRLCPASYRDTAEYLNLPHIVGAQRCVAGRQIALEIAATVACTVEEQNNAVASIAEGVNRASVEAKTGANAMSRVAGATIGARATAADVKALADALSVEAESLQGEVRRFLTEVQAA